jgi:hypothetical protein
MTFSQSSGAIRQTERDHFQHKYPDFHHRSRAQLIIVSAKEGLWPSVARPLTQLTHIQTNHKIIAAVWINNTHWVTNQLIIDYHTAGAL